LVHFSTKEILKTAVLYLTPSSIQTHHTNDMQQYEDLFPGTDIGQTFCYCFPYKNICRYCNETRLLLEDDKVGIRRIPGNVSDVNRRDLLNNHNEH